MAAARPIPGLLGEPDPGRKGHTETARGRRRPRAAAKAARGGGRAACGLVQAPCSRPAGKRSDQNERKEREGDGEKERGGPQGGYCHSCTVTGSISSKASVTFSLSHCASDSESM